MTFDALKGIMERMFPATEAPTRPSPAQLSERDARNRYALYALYPDQDAQWKKGRELGFTDEEIRTLITESIYQRMPEASKANRQRNELNALRYENEQTRMKHPLKTPRSRES